MAVRLSLLVLFAVAGCKASSQLGEECTLVKRDPSDGGSLFLTNGELPAGAGKDFISFGSTECDDLICVRDWDYAPLDGGGLNPNEPAKGYCSRSCLIGSPCPASSAELDASPRTRLTCRSLLLDVATLGSSKVTALGTFTSSDFCARGAAGADAGT